jgi:2'-5' RNA ligase
MQQFSLPLSRTPDTDRYVRVLVCLRPDARLRRKIDSYARRIYTMPAKTQTAPERLHLTLFYCPAVHVDQLGPLDEGLSRVRFDLLDLAFLQPVAWDNGICAFLPLEQRGIAILRDKIQVAAWRAGLRHNTHSPSTAHITVSREPRAVLQLGCPVRADWLCGGFELVHSPAYPAPYVEIARYAATGCGARTPWQGTALESVHHAAHSRQEKQIHGPGGL